MISINKFSHYKRQKKIRVGRNDCGKHKTKEITCVFQMHEVSFCVNFMQQKKCKYEFEIW